MNWLQRKVKRNALKQSKEYIKFIENAKRQGLMKKDVADNLLKSLKASVEGVDDDKTKEKPKG